jgi:hypothetical protein
VKRNSPVGVVTVAGGKGLRCFPPKKKDSFEIKKKIQELWQAWAAIV